MFVHEWFKVFQQLPDRRFFVDRDSHFLLFGFFISSQKTAVTWSLVQILYLRNITFLTAAECVLEEVAGALPHRFRLLVVILLPGSV